MSITLTDIRQRLEELARRRQLPPEEHSRIVPSEHAEYLPPPNMGRPTPQPRARPPRSASDIVHDIADYDAEIKKLCSDLVRVSTRRRDACEELQIVLEADTEKAQHILDSSERIWEYFFGPRPSIACEEPPQDGAAPAGPSADLNVAAG